MFSLESLSLLSTVIIGICVIIVGVIMISTNSMGLECFNAKGHETFAGTKQANKSFLIFTLIVSIIMVLIGMAIIGFRLYGKSLTGI